MWLWRAPTGLSTFSLTDIVWHYSYGHGLLADRLGHCRGATSGSGEQPPAARQ